MSRKLRLFRCYPCIGGRGSVCVSQGRWLRQLLTFPFAPEAHQTPLSWSRGSHSYETVEEDDDNNPLECESELRGD